MAKAGDCYTVILKNSYVAWGEYRNTLSRPPIRGEGYIPIPRRYAIKFNLLNNNGTNGQDILGENLFRYRTADGSQKGILRAQGSSEHGDKYAKQFSVDKNLKEIGKWFVNIGATVGSEIKVEWTSPQDIVLSKCR